MDKSAFCRNIGIEADAAVRIHETRFRQFTREGLASPTYLIERYAPHRRRATVAALLIELEVRLTDVALDMVDKLVGNAFTRGKNTKERAYVATTKDVGRLMRLFDRTIEALSQAQGADRDAFAVVDETVGWAQLLRARSEIASLAALTEEDPLVRAADRYATIRKFAPALLEVLEFKAAILADGTNLGLARMAEASQGVTRDQLVWTADAYIRSETYQAALVRIIDAHHRLPVAAVWGVGTTSSSDGQFFRSGKRGNVAGEINARYGVDPGFSFYTHVSDQHAPYHVRVISAATHEAPYVLDGLLHHGTSLKIDTHYVDTGGVSDHVFILCVMLGFRFCPRLRDFPDRKLASIEPATAYPTLQPLLGRRIKVDVIREHWHEVVRLVASLKAGTVAPSAMLRKLAAYERQNQLDLALQELGRIERTLFMLDWLESPELRRRCQAGLNKGEQRHALAQAICTFKQGRIADRGTEAQQYRASGLNLLIAAIVYWNSTYMADAVVHLRATGEVVPDEWLTHTSPVGWEHIGLSGDFLWDRAAALPVGRRSLNLARRRDAA